MLSILKHPIEQNEFMIRELYKISFYDKSPSVLNVQFDSQYIFNFFYVVTLEAVNIKPKWTSQIANLMKLFLV